MPDEKKNTDEVSGRSLWDFILTILRDRKLLIIAIPLVIVGLVIYWFFVHPIPPHPSPQPPKCVSWTLTGRVISDSGEFLNLKGVTIGVESGPYSFDDQIVNGDFRIRGFTFPKDNFIKLYLQKNGRINPFYLAPFDSSRMRLDYNSCVLLFEEDLIVHNDVMNQVAPPINTPPAPRPHVKTFSINIDDDAIRKEIAQITGYRYDPASSANRVVVTFDSSKIVSVGPGTYNFLSSNAIVQIDSRKYKLADCVIPAPAFPSHDKQEVLDEVKAQSETVAISCLRSHANTIAKWITGP